LVDLGRIQQRLKIDPDYRSRFLKDPVAALAEQGLILPPAMHSQIRGLVAQAHTAAGTVPGAAVGPGRINFVYGATGSRGIPLIIAFE